MNDASDTSAKLALRVRRRRGELLAHEWLPSLSAVLGTELSASDLVSFEATEALKAQFFEKLVHDPQPVRKTWPDPLPKGPPAPTDVVQHVRDLALNHDVEGIFFSEADYNMGAVRVSANAVLRHANEVWRLTREDLAFTTRDLGDGFCLEYNHHGAHTADGDELGIYEVTVWGRLVR